MSDLRSYGTPDQFSGPEEKIPSDEQLERVLQFIWIKYGAMQNPFNSLAATRRIVSDIRDRLTIATTPPAPADPAIQGDR